MDPAVRALFDHINRLALEEVPDARPGASYGMPALMLGGKALIAVKAATRHLSLYPFSGTVVEAVRDELAGHALSKGTVRFSVDNPLPDEVVRRIVRLRAAEIGPASG